MTGKELWVSPRDCLEGLCSVEDSTVSMILTDPPYFIDGMGDDWDAIKLRQRIKPGVVGGGAGRTEV